MCLQIDYHLNKQEIQTVTNQYPNNVCPVTWQVHITSIKDQEAHDISVKAMEDTHTDVLTGDDWLNAINLNATIKDTMATSLLDR